MQSFLKKTSEYIFERHGEEMGNICIVLPNRRAKLFIQRHLAEVIQKTIWSPEIYSIEDFIIKLSGLNIADNIQLIFELYNTHKTINKEKAETFEEFLNWGQMLLHDLNEVDLYLVKPEEIFTYLNDAKNISHWNPDKSEPTENQKKYLQFFSSMLEYYKNFTASLLEKKEVYNGLAYRQVAENIDTIEKTVTWNKIYFAGLNAFTTAEEKIIRYFIKQGKAEILWDADKYYMDDASQESGIFLRNYKSTWGLKDFRWTDDNYSSGKNINVTGIPKQIGQAKYAGQLISEIYKADKESISNTAVVLADENLLLPLLNSMPEELSSFNVTMGLPIKYIPLADLFNTIFSIHENAAKLNRRDAKGNIRFYFKDILKFLDNTYIKRVTNDELRIANTELRNFLSRDELIKALEEANKNIKDNTKILSVFDNLYENPKSALEHFVNLIDIIKERILNEEEATDADKSETLSSRSKIDLEYLYSFAKIIKRIKTLFETNQTLFKASFSFKSLRLLFSQIVSSSTIPFYGEPLKGLQIMGVLETRTLDFENIIMLSVNENLLPSAKTNNSFIPFDIRKKFRLPTYHDRDSIFAYHFYRLLQRAKNIHLIYNTENDDFGKGEKSRFITQMLYELPEFNADINIRSEILSIPPSKEDTVKPIIIEKTEGIIKRLQEKAKTGFSPSTLNTYRNCSLQFYYSEVKRLREAEEVEETIEAATLGTVIHDVLQTLYKPYIGKELRKDDILQMLPKVNEITEKSFKEFYESGDITTGKNLLIVKVANKFITNFLQTEIKFISNSTSPLIIKDLEHRISSEFKIQNSDIKILLKGFIDRIDSIGNTIRIVDYKTGNINRTLELKIKDWGDMMDDRNLSKSFQMLLYSWLYMKNNPETGRSTSLIPGLISFRKLSEGLMTMKFPPDDTEIFTKGISLQIEAIITQLLSDIFDRSKPFVQTEDRDMCEYCPYKGVCIR